VKFSTEVVVEESAVGGYIWDSPPSDVENASVGSDFVACGDVVRRECEVVLAEERRGCCGLIVWCWEDV